MTTKDLEGADEESKLAELEAWMEEQRARSERAAERTEWRNRGKRRERGPLWQRQKCSAMAFAECLGKLRELRGNTDGGDDRWTKYSSIGSRELT